MPRTCFRVKPKAAIAAVKVTKKTEKLVIIRLEIKFGNKLFCRKTNLKFCKTTGNKKSTVQNLVVVKVDVEKNLILVKGAIPGPKGGLVTVREAVKR